VPASAVMAVEVRISDSTMRRESSSRSESMRSLVPTRLSLV